MKPGVTLITPFYNAMPYFEDYLESVVAQSWRPLEFLAVNDGSTDASEACFRKALPKLEEAGIETRLIQLAHAGQAAAVNAALPYVSGEFLTWCDADDLMVPENVEKKALFLLEHLELGMVRSDGLVVGAGSGKLIKRSAKDSERKTENIFGALFSDETYCFAGCYMLRTSLLFECYPERRLPESPEGQNLQLLLPPASRSDCGFVPEALHTYRVHPDSHSGRPRSLMQAMKRLENFTALRLAILPYCLCDRELYEKEALRIEKMRKKELMDLAAFKAREELSK